MLPNFNPPSDNFHKYKLHSGIALYAVTFLGTIAFTDRYGGVNIVLVCIALTVCGFATWMILQGSDYWKEMLQPQLDKNLELTNKKLEAEIRKLNAETAKIQAETQKIIQDRFQALRPRTDA